MNAARLLGMSVLLLGACATPREVKITTAEPLRAFARCMAHALDHSRPDLRHVAVPAADGAWEVLSRERGRRIDRWKLVLRGGGGGR